MDGHIFAVILEPFKLTRVYLFMERTEPTLSGGPIANEQTSTASRASSSRPIQAVSQHESGPGFTTVLALLLAFAGLGGSGFLAWKFTEAQKQLISAEGRIAGLETRLNLNSDQSTQTVEDIEDKLEWADSEIRKLWGISNDKNKKSIQSNSDKIIRLKRSLKTAETNTSKAQKLTASTKLALESKISVLQDTVNQSTVTITQLEQQSTTNAQLSQELNRIAQQMPGLRSLASRVKTNEEAVTAIDAYRRSINRDILQLKQQIKTATP